MKILPSGLCDRRRVPPPRLPRPDRAAADGRRGPRVPGRRARDPRQARRADRPADRQRRLRRALDEQVGRPAAGQPQVPGRRGGRGLAATGSAARSPRNAPYDEFVRRRSSRPAARTARTRRPPTSRSSATRRTRWRTPRTCSWACGSTATSATTIPSSAGRRTNTTRRPPTSPRSSLKPDPATGDRKIGGTDVEGAEAAVRDRRRQARRAR